MADNARIKMNVKQTAEDQTDSSELFTKGEYRLHNGSYYIDYDESEATGFSGSHVQLKVDGDIVTMTRTGRAFSSLLFEEGERHFCHYGTEYGDCMIGITTTKLRHVMADNGGEIEIKYTIDVNGGLMLTNEIKININTI